MAKGRKPKPADKKPAKNLPGKAPKTPPPKPSSDLPAAPVVADSALPEAAPRRSLKARPRTGRPPGGRKKGEELKTMSALLAFGRDIQEGMPLWDAAIKAGISEGTAKNWLATVRAIWREALVTTAEIEFAQTDRLLRFAWEQLELSKQGIRTREAKTWDDSNGGGSSTLRRIVKTGAPAEWASLIKWCIEHKTKMKGGYDQEAANKEREHEMQARVAGKTREEIMVMLAARVNFVLGQMEQRP